MNLKTYLKRKNLTPTILSKIFQVSRSTIYNWLKGVRPHRKVAQKIEKKTQGEVKMKDLGHKK